MNNAIVIMFDSLQRTYLGCYGNTWIKTPNMDRLAREGVLFENCYIEGVPTVPCRRAMHTGCYTLHGRGWSPLTMEETTIADLCWGRPIDTAIIFDCPMYRLPKFGYTRGFDKVYYTHGHELDHFFYLGDPLYHYNPHDYLEDHISETIDRVHGKTVRDPLIEELEAYLKQMQYWRSDEDRYVAKTIKNAIKYLAQVDRNKQFYLWIDSFDPHEPWNPPSVVEGKPAMYDPNYKGKHQFLPVIGAVKDVFTEEELHHVRMLYAESVTVCDKWLGILMDAVRSLGFEENTLFLMVSDHGEPMGNGEHGHGIMRKCRPWPYEELVHAPMLLRAPGIKAGQRIKAFVQSCDVAPTVCDWLGIGVHPDMTGKSLLPLVRGEVTKVRDFAIAGYYKYSWAIYEEGWSFIHWMHNAHNLSELEAGDFYNADNGFTNINMGSMQDDETLKSMKAAASLDGEDQWTCTPGSTVEVPDIDELYDMTKDPFQLHNVISQHPQKAQEMLQKVSQFINGLKA